MVKFAFTACSTAVLQMLSFALLYYVVFRNLQNTPVAYHPVLDFLDIKFKGDMYSYFISAVIGYTASYIMNRKLTFKANTNVLLSGILYALMVVVTVAFNTWFGSFLNAWLKTNGWDNFFTIMLASLITMLVPTLWTYPLQRFVILRQRTPQTEEPTV